MTPARPSPWSRIGLALEVVFYGGVTLAFLAAAVTVFRPEARAHADRITVGLNWVPETEHCGFFQAQETGLYRKAGLDVEIVNGGPDVNLPLLVGSGRMSLGMGTSFTTLNMVNNHIDAETVASFFQKDPQTLIAHAGQNIHSLEDMKGRPIMVGNFSRQEFWQFLKARYGFTDDQLRPYDNSPGPFIADPTAIAQGYVTQDQQMIGVHMKEPMVSFLLADYGFEDYSQTIFGMRPWIDAHKDEVRRFVHATAQGYRDCTYGDPHIAMAPILKRNPEHGVALYDFKRKQMRDLGMVAGGDAATLGIGAMTEARWKSFYDTMVKAGLYPPDLDWRRAFTLEFLDPKDRVTP